MSNKVEGEGYDQERITGKDNQIQSQPTTSITGKNSERRKDSTNNTVPHKQVHPLPNDKKQSHHIS